MWFLSLYWNGKSLSLRFSDLWLRSQVSYKVINIHFDVFLKTFRNFIFIFLVTLSHSFEAVIINSAHWKQEPFFKQILPSNYFTVFRTYLRKKKKKNVNIITIPFRKSKKLWQICCKFEYQRRIQNPAKLLRWNFLQKSFSDILHGCEYSTNITLVLGIH